MNKKYTENDLRNDICRFIEKNGRLPISQEMKRRLGYISYRVYQGRYGTWNKALEHFNFTVNKCKHDETTKCSVCGSNKTTIHWYYDQDKNIICSKCSKCERGFIKGTLNPLTTIAIGIITEYVVYKVLQDCIKCNDDTLCAKYDLISEKYGTINVKSSKLNIQNISRWMFGKSENSKIPDYYVCIGFDENKTEIQRVWFIPRNSNLIVKRGISISTNQLQRALQYEVDATPYNEVYQNLDITTLPEFRNLNIEGESCKT